jgi:prepilin-type N-terminal cleavage/methylation domain-containing protein
MKYYSINKRNEGFTLIEVMIAIVILTIGLLALVSVTVMVIKGNSLNRGITTATTLANQQLETLKNTSYDTIPLSTSWSDVTNFPGYQRSLEVVEVEVGNQKTIGSKVRWLWLGSYHEVTLNTIISK